MDVLSLIKNSLQTAADGGSSGCTNNSSSSPSSPSLSTSNPISKHFRLLRHAASAGPEMVWKIYDAIRLVDGKEMSVFLFEKKVAEKLHKPRRRETVTELLRNEVKLLSRLKHPRVLKVIHPLEECHDSLAFATVAIHASLANLLGNHDRLPPSSAKELKDHSFLEVEIKFGLLQISEALLYVHGAEHIVHMNVCPQSVVVTKRGVWKLTGFAFAECPTDANTTSCCYPASPWTPKHSKMAQPDLDYMAPDVQHPQLPPPATGAGNNSATTQPPRATPASDIYSFGQLICALYNDGKSLVHASHNVTTYNKQCDQVMEQFNELSHKMPQPLYEQVEKMLNRDSRLRPTLQQFASLKYFDDPVVRCMQMLDSVDANDLLQKFEFFNKLPRALPICPPKLLHNSLLPMMKEQLEYPDMLEFLLPSFIAIVQHFTDEEYRKYVRSDFRKIFSMTRPVQATVYLLENLNVILAKLTDEDIKTDVLPMIFSAFESNSLAIQEAAINVFGSIPQYLDDQTMRCIVLPKAKALFNKTTQVRARLNALECIGRLLNSLDKMVILEEVVPFLTEIQCSEAEIVMAMTGIYNQLTNGNDHCTLSHNVLATKVMPSLIPHAVSPALNIGQFTDLMEVLHRMLSQVESGRLNKMIDEAPDATTIEHRRRKSIDMRYMSTSTSNLSSNGGSSGKSQQQQQQQQQPPSSPSHQLLATTTTSNENTNSKSPTQTLKSLVNGMPEVPLLSPREPTVLPPGRRRSSYQGLLRVDERASAKRPAGERRASLFHPLPTPAGNPHILVSEASVSNFDELFGSSPIPLRRASTQSVGAVIVAEPGRRDSKGRLVDRVEDANRRSSFQGICEHAVHATMEYFMGKEKSQEQV